MDKAWMDKAWMDKASGYSRIDHAAGGSQRQVCGFCQSLPAAGRHDERSRQILREMAAQWLELAEVALAG
jgi:hypothetical protein